MLIRLLFEEAGRTVTPLLLSPFGRRFAGGTKIYTGLYLLAKNIMERPEKDILRKYVEPGMVVADIGANVGFFTGLFSRLVGPTGQVHAFEPDPLIYSILKRRTATLPLHNISVNKVALSDRIGTSLLFSSKKNRGDNRLFKFDEDEDFETFEVATTTLDSYCEKHGIKKIDGIKIDVQGAEPAILRGMRGLLENSPPSWIVFEFFPKGLLGAGEDLSTFFSLLEGYKLFHTLKNALLPVTDLQELARTLGNGYTNILALNRKSYPVENFTKQASAKPQESDLPVRTYFDAIASQYDYWKKRNWYYHDSIKNFYHRRIPRDSSVLDFGCGTGDILAAIDPRDGIGMDISGEMIRRAKDKYPDLEWHHCNIVGLKKEAPGKFDFILLSDVIEHMENLRKNFLGIRDFCTDKTKILINMYNPTWEPILLFLEKIGKKMPEGPHQRISVKKLDAILHDCGFKRQKRFHRLLFPISVPFVSPLLNKLGSLPPFNRLCLIEFLEYSVDFGN